MADLLAAATLTVRLTDIRDTQRSLADHGVRHGHKGWIEEIRPWCELLQKAAADGEGFLALRYIAAAVEIIEPTEGAAPDRREGSDHG